MDINHVKEVLQKDELKKGLEKYLDIMGKIHETDVSKDQEFQKKFNGFYKIRQRKPEFYQAYYRFMELKKNTELSFEETLDYIYESCGRYETSFCSKLVATINPDSPVWDTFVLENTGVKAPYPSSKDRVKKIVTTYETLVKWYEKFLNTEDCKKMIALFDEQFPKTPITNLKKIDLILWQMR